MPEKDIRSQTIAIPSGPLHYTYVTFSGMPLSDNRYDPGKQQYTIEY